MKKDLCGLSHSHVVHLFGGTFDITGGIIDVSTFSFCCIGGGDGGIYDITGDIKCDIIGDIKCDIIGDRCFSFFSFFMKMFYFLQL